MLVIEISKYLGIKNVIEPKIKPPLHEEIINATNVNGQLGANLLEFLLTFFERSLSFDGFSAFKNKIPYRIQITPGKKTNFPTAKS